jgi:hypothetical protein
VVTTGGAAFLVRKSDRHALLHGMQATAGFKGVLTGNTAFWVSGGASTTIATLAKAAVHGGITEVRIEMSIGAKTELVEACTTICANIDFTYCDGHRATIDVGKTIGQSDAVSLFPGASVRITHGNLKHECTNAPASLRNLNLSLDPPPPPPPRPPQTPPGESVDMPHWMRAPSS